MRSDLKMPGLKMRNNRDGTRRLYWCARSDLVKAGYEPETVRLHRYEQEFPNNVLLVSAACLRLQVEMLAWSTQRGKDRYRFDGTLKSLIRRYEHDAASPYRELKWNTRRTYDQVLSVVEKAFGKRVLAKLSADDFRRWYDEAKKPKTTGGEERIRKAHGIINMLRRLMSFGVMAEIGDCVRLKVILDHSRFKQPARRRARLEFIMFKRSSRKPLRLGARRWL